MELYKPYKLIWTSILIILGLSMIDMNASIDLQLHDTYYVIGLTHIGLMFSLMLGLIGLIYWLIRKKKMVTWMTSIHVILTIVTLTLIILTGLIFRNSDQTNYEVYKTVNQGVFILTASMIVTQLIFILNLIISLVRNENRI